jgi:peptide/nickel transport system substrate-binding protein
MSRSRMVARPMALLALAAMIAGGCGSSHKNGGGTGTTAVGGTTPAAAQAPVDGGMLTYAHGSDPPTLDPATMQSFSSFAGLDMYFDVYGALFVADTTAKPPTVHPLLAQSLTTSDGGLSWSLKLKPNLVFSDGTPLDAAAVKSNWDRIANPANSSPMVGVTLNIASTVATDAQTLSITLHKANTLFPNTVTESALSYIASPTAIQKEGKDYGTKPVGAGPFVLNSWVSGGASNWTKNPTYFDAKDVHLSGLKITSIFDTTGKVNAFTTGADNLVNCSQESVANQIKAAGGTVTTIPLLGDITVQWNVKQAPFNDNSMRLAFTEALNRDAIAQAYNLGIPAPMPKGLVESGSPYYEPSATYPSYNLSAAQSAVSAYVAKNGPIHLTLLFTSGNPAPLDAATVMQQELQQLKGVTVTLTSLDLSAYVTYLFTGKYNVTFYGLTFPNIADPVFYDLFHTGGVQNSSGFSDPKVDAALDDSRSTFDATRQQADYATVQKQLTEDGYFAPVAPTPANYQCSTKKLHFFFYADGIPRTDQIWIGQ